MRVNLIESVMKKCYMIWLKIKDLEALLKGYYSARSKYNHVVRANTNGLVEMHSQKGETATRI